MTSIFINFGKVSWMITFRLAWPPVAVHKGRLIRKRGVTE
jgi:hypothetical protein